MEHHQVFNKAVEHFKNKQFLQVIQLLEPLKSQVRETDLSRAISTSLGKAYFKIDEPEIALKHFQELISSFPNEPEHYYLGGICAMSLNRQPLAQDLFKKSLDLDDNQPSCLLNLAASYRQNEQAEQAIPYYQKLCKYENYTTRAYRNLSMCKKYQSLDDPDIKGILSTLENRKLSKEQQSHLYFALGKIYQDCDMPDQSFAAFHKANQLKNKPDQFNLDEYQKKLHDLMQLFSALSYPEFGHSEDPNHIFIIGIPRGGKTLLEKVLSLSNEVYALEEFAVVDKLAYRFTNNRPFKFNETLRAKLQSAEFFNQFYHEYKNKIATRTLEPFNAFIETTPCNFRYVGYIYGMFNPAKFIHVTRNPIDHIFMIYTKYFSTGNYWAFNLKNIVYYYADYRQAMDFWKKELPTQIHEVRYEDLIFKPKETALEIFEMAGVPTPENITQNLDTLALNADEIGIYKQFPEFLEVLKPYIKVLEPYLEV